MEKGVEVRTVEADLQDFEIEKDTWDGIVSIFAHVPPSIRKSIHTQVVDGLKSGGIFILEAFTVGQLDMDSVGGPPASQPGSIIVVTQACQAYVENGISQTDYFSSRFQNQRLPVFRN
jgi:hypothetical protein